MKERKESDFVKGKRSETEVYSDQLTSSDAGIKQ